MNLHIELDKNHPSYNWLEKQADKIGARGHFGTHIDCYTTQPSQSEFALTSFLLDCRIGMPTTDIARNLPNLHGKALILYTANMFKHDYGETQYFESDTTLQEDVLEIILSKQPSFILIDSYGIGKHGEDHIAKDQKCETLGCFVIENICITPECFDKIGEIKIKIALDYPSTGKPCRISFDY